MPLPTYAERGVRVINNLNHHSQKVGTYRALIVGINEYQDSNISDLQTAVNDAEEMARILTKYYGFTTELLLDQNATRKAIYQALRDLVISSKADDSVLIYYAGHGDLDRTFDDGWWIPSDAKGGDPVTYLDNGMVQKAIRSMKARHVLLISDACFSGTLFGGKTRKAPKVIDNNYYLSLYNEKSRWGMTSGNKTPVADSGTQGHSVFAYQLLKNLRENKKPYISTQEIYTKIAPVISNNSDQTPLCRPIHNTGDQGGEFVFITVNNSAEYSSVDTKPGALLTVNSNISGAEVYVDDEFIGLTDFAAMKFEPGKHQIRVEHKGYRSFKREISLKAGRKKSLYAFLDKTAPAMATLNIHTEPLNALIRILNTKSKFRQGMEFLPGAYEIEVSAQGFKSHRKKITLSAAEDKELNIFLDKIEILPDKSPEGEAQGLKAKSPPIKAALPSVTPLMHSTEPAIKNGSWDIVSNSLGMAFVHVKPGNFTMGSPTNEKGRYFDETSHQVILKQGFYIGQTEVTVGQWRRFIQATAYKTEAETGEKQPFKDVTGSAMIAGLSTMGSVKTEKKSKSIFWEEPGFSQSDNHPVTCISYNDAQQFIKWLSKKEGRNYRLPTEAQWEYAHRAGDKTASSWGKGSDNACRYSNVADKALKKELGSVSIHACEDGIAYTAPIAQFVPNAFGLFDTTGNVKEWCRDKYGSYFNNRTIIRGVMINRKMEGPLIDPQGPKKGSMRVIRGGGWDSPPEECRAAYRDKKVPEYWNNNLGFRLVGDF